MSALMLISHFQEVSWVLPGCNVYLELAPLPAFLPLAFQGGTSFLPVTVPPGSEGFQVALQAFEPTGFPVNLSNGLLLTIGH